MANQPWKVSIASLVGTTIEYYDFFIFGTAAALVFPELFFPESSALMGTLQSFAILGVGFLARPLGGFVFGHFGDLVGRKKMLVISLVGMGAATFFMGVLPSYHTIGIAAPILLTVLRLFQGFMVGGEWGGATLMAVEHAPRGKRGFFGSFPQMGAPAGTALANIVFLLVALMPSAQFISWGWRIPFLFSALLVVVGLFIRLTVGESPEFERARNRQELVRLPLKEAFSRHTGAVLLVAGGYLSQGVIAYIFIAYMVNYTTTVVGYEKLPVLLAIILASFIAIFGYGACGYLSDILGRRTMYFTGAVLMAISVWPAFWMIDTGHVGLMTLAIVLVFGLAMSPASGVTGPLFSLLFPRKLRYTGVSAGYTISQILGSAFAPMIAAGLYARYQSSTAIVIYLLVISAISVISIALIPGKWGPAEGKAQLREFEEEQCA
ncbi:MAG: MFS transporter [Bowdeniella nasicola]|nr:MFS transporter [Bowdeniella nasicola]